MKNVFHKSVRAVLKIPFLFLDLMISPSSSFGKGIVGSPSLAGIGGLSTGIPPFRPRGSAQYHHRYLTLSTFHARPLTSFSFQTFDCDWLPTGAFLFTQATQGYRSIGDHVDSVALARS